MDLLVCIYMARLGGSYRAFISHDPQLDASVLLADSATKKSGCMDLLTPYVPIGIADYALRSVFTEEEITGRLIERKSYLNSLFEWLGNPGGYDSLLHQKCRKIRGLLAEIARFFGQESLLSRINDFPVRIYPGQLKPENIIKRSVPSKGIYAVLKSLEGRLLFYEELQKSLLEHGFDENFNVLDILQVLALQDTIRIFPAVGITSPGVITCFRCGLKTQLKASFSSGDNETGIECPICGFPLIYCKECSVLGESRICKGLFAMKRPAKSEYEPVYPQCEVGVPPLTPAQARASLQISQFIKTRKTNKCLLWAAAGAGKTEVVLEAMAEVIKEGGRVLYTAPRRDVVIEIAPRLQKAFRDLTVKAVYGGSPEHFVTAPVIAATVHQVLRFYQNFDLIVFDEVDAYPYRDNRMLEMAVNRALKPGGQIVYMTATPSRELLSLCDRGKSEKVIIPARYHGYPVPEPLLLKKAPFIKERADELSAAPEVVQILLNWVLNRNGQVFVFLPTVEMVEKHGPVIKKALIEEGHTECLADINAEIISLSHAKDPLRDVKRERFKAGETRVFITTSIMERGITVSNAYVLVLEADFERVYDEGTLIQMAGRAGRSAQFPHGEAVFVAKRVSGAMKSAREKIEYLNKQARQHGFLKQGW